MRTVILNLAVSLDGFIEGPGGEFDWCFTDQDYGMKDFMSRIDAILMGRKSYEVMRQYEQRNPFPDKTTYVFSRTIQSADPKIVILRGTVEEEVKDILNRPGKDLWLFGGANLVTAFVKAGLVDELWLAVHPLLLGSGKPLFQGISDRIPLNLITTKTYSSGLVQLFYGRKKK